MTWPGFGGPLGCADNYRVYAYDRGALDMIGEIKPIQRLQWSRVRDDISNALLTTAGFGPDCCDLLNSLRSMRHELVIFRDEERVWEGPITRVAFASDGVEIEARDVMQYIYRRICRLGYNHRYPFNIDPEPDKKKKKYGNPVTDTVRLLITQALVPNHTPLPDDPHEPPEFAFGYDPNILKYLTIFPPKAIDALKQGNSREARQLYVMQKTVWEEIDDMAANAGIDYTVAGRRIMVWDTSNPIGRTVPLDDSAFMANPIVTEYGMSLATCSVVTDGKGFYGIDGGYDSYYGTVEILASSYSESTAPDKAGIPTYRKLQDYQNIYYTRRAEYLRYPGLSTREAHRLAAYYKERYTKGVKPERQKVLDAAIKPLAAREKGKKTLLTRMNHAHTTWKQQQKLYDNYNSQITSYIAGLTSQARRNLAHRNPAPITVRIPDNSQLNPNVMLGINDLIPGIWIPLRSNATCRHITQWQKLDSVSVSMEADQAEQVQVTMSPAPAAGADPDAEQNTPEE